MNRSIEQHRFHIASERIPSYILRSTAALGIAYTIGVSAGSIRDIVIQTVRTHGLNEVADNEHNTEPLLFGISPDQNNINRIPYITNQTGLEYSIGNIFVHDHEQQWNRVSQWLDDAKIHNITPMISMGRTKEFFFDPNDSGDSRYINWKHPEDFMKNVGFEESLRVFARKLRDRGELIYLRPFFEMNGNWFDFGSQNITPEDFKRGWRYLYNLFQSEGATNVKFVLSLNSTISAKDLNDYIPEDTYYDVIGLDIYDKATTDRSNSFSYISFPKLSPEALIGPDVQTVMSHTHKDIFITELGSYEDPVWMEKSILYLSKYSQVKAIMTFAWQKANEGKPDETDWETQLLRISIADLGTNRRIKPSIKEQIVINNFIKQLIGANVYLKHQTMLERGFTYLFGNRPDDPKQPMPIKQAKNRGIGFQIAKEKIGLSITKEHAFAHKGVVYRHGSSSPWNKVN